METPITQIFNRFRKDYLQQYSATVNQHKVMNAIMVCKTEKLGYNIEKCDSCSHSHIHYNSCNNRHCPNCQGIKKQKWILDKENDILPVKYMHVVFTVPAELRALFLYNKRLLYSLLFKTVWATIESFSHDKRNRLEADMGMISILHTWTQQLEYHPHIHCIIPSGGITINNRWKTAPTDGDYLFNVEALSKAFKGLFMKELKEIYRNKELKFHDLKGCTVGQYFYDVKQAVYKKEWVVYAKKSFRNKKSVFEYLARYTHKIAISNYRIKLITETHVTFEYLDRADDNNKKIKTVTGVEFIKLFLKHVLPPRFVKIRNYGFLSSRTKTDKLTVLMEYFKMPKYQKAKKKLMAELLEIIYGIDLSICPKCKKGKMHTIKTKLRPKAA